MVLWVFGYGSLVWNPGFDFDEKIIGYVRDYRRVFTLACIDHRGTPENPARTLTLEASEGGICWGAAYCVKGGPEKEKAAMKYLEKRECEYDLKSYVDFYCKVHLHSRQGSQQVLLGSCSFGRHGEANCDRRRTMREQQRLPVLVGEGHERHRSRGRVRDRACERSEEGADGAAGGEDYESGCCCTSGYEKPSSPHARCPPSRNRRHGRTLEHDDDVEESRNASTWQHDASGSDLGLFHSFSSSSSSSSSSPGVVYMQFSFPI